MNVARAELMIFLSESKVITVTTSINIETTANKPCAVANAAEGNCFLKNFIAKAIPPTAVTKKRIIVNPNILCLLSF